MLNSLKITLALIYKLIPFSLVRKRKKVCFASVPNFSDSSLAVARHMIKNNPEYEIFWLVVGSGNIAAPADIAEHIHVVKKNTLRGFWHFVSSALVFHTHGIYSFVKGGGPFQVGLWHGMPIKNIGFRDGKSQSQVVYSDVVISTSAYFSKIMAESFGLPLERVWLTGLPRNDDLANSNPEDRNYLERFFGGNANTKIVAWLPTYRQSYCGDVRIDSLKKSFLDEWDSGFLKRLDDFCSKENIAIFIKLHPMDYLNNNLPAAALKSIRLITSEQWEAYGFDLYRALSCSDALISDISSVIVDYFVTGKPIGITTKSIDSYERGIISEIKSLLSRCYTLTDELSLNEFLAEKPKSYCSSDKITEELFYDKSVKDSHAASRVLRKALVSCD